MPQQLCYETRCVWQYTALFYRKRNKFLNVISRECPLTAKNYKDLSICIYRFADTYLLTPHFPVWFSSTCLWCSSQLRSKNTDRKKQILYLPCDVPQSWNYSFILWLCQPQFQVLMRLVKWQTAAMLRSWPQNYQPWGWDCFAISGRRDEDNQRRADKRKSLQSHQGVPAPGLTTDSLSCSYSHDLSSGSDMSFLKV